MASFTGGRYVRAQQLARGGMGEVELAARVDGSFQRLYAVKRLRPMVRQDPSARQMFIEEARLAGRIRHPNVVSVLDVGEDRDGPYLVMDLVEGISAQALLRWATKNGVSLPVQLVLRIVGQVARGLHAAHELSDSGVPLSLVHRDVSPQNILIGFDGVARIADFGIAKALGRVNETSTGLLKGKAGYLSPEQLRFTEPDRRSDIFALGVVLFELLASRRLYFEEEMIAAARRILEEPPPDIDELREDVPPRVIELSFEMLAKDPKVRPPTAAAVADRLELCVGELAETEGIVDVAAYFEANFAGEKKRVEARSRLAVERARTAEKRRRRRPLVLAAAGLALVSLGIGSFAVARSMRPVEPTVESPIVVDDVLPRSAGEAPSEPGVGGEAPEEMEVVGSEPEPPSMVVASERRTEAPTMTTRPRRPRPTMTPRPPRPTTDRLFTWE
ncbi:MAG: serine/threonine-protein kinase [Myxococcota bacterium]